MLLTVQQAASYAQTDPWLVVAAIDNRKLKGISLSGDAGQLRTKREWLDRWIKGR